MHAKETNSKNDTKPDRPLRYGWTTGACACAAAKAAAEALFSGQFPNPVQILLPRGRTPEFALEVMETGEGWARAGVIKDAGDDPDVTHGALIISRISRGSAGQGVVFRAGEGVGTVTLSGLMLAVGEPAINPVPRQIITEALEQVAISHGQSCDLVVEISVPGGERIAKKTLNARLGILGGISILGTTGVVTPYSCSAWIHSIHRGIDVARAGGINHMAASVGSTSEKMIGQMYQLPDIALIDMGDFVGGVLKYIRKHPVQRLTMAGGFAKFSKLAAGEMDLHSKRCRVDFLFLARQMEFLGADGASVEQVKKANTALEVFNLSRANAIDLADHIATLAHGVCAAKLRDAQVELEILISDREGRLIGRAP